MKKILITGKGGQIGWELQRALATLGHLVACDRQMCNLERPDQAVKLIRDVRPEIIVNAAAYTAVDKAESDAEAAMQVNGKAPGILAEEAKKLNAVFVHYSTDYVFNGNSGNVPYEEEDEAHPLNVYGRTKLAGEKAVAEVGGKAFVFRTSWVYGNRGKNFLLTILKLAKERDQLKIVMDQVGAPTWSRMIAHGTAHVLMRFLANPDEKLCGMYHMSAAGQTTWYGFAEAILHLAAKKEGLKVPEVMGIPSYEYPLPAKRPQYSVLSNQKIQTHFGLYMPSWDEMLALVD